MQVNAIYALYRTHFYYGYNFDMYFVSNLDKTELTKDLNIVNTIFN